MGVILSLYSAGMGSLGLRSMSLTSIRFVRRFLARWPALIPSCKMRKWNTVDELVDAHIANDPYFPVARRGEQVYKAFRSGYRAAYTARLDIADEFLSQLEALQDAVGQVPP